MIFQAYHAGLNWPNAYSTIAAAVPVRSQVVYADSSFPASTMALMSMSGELFSDEYRSVNPLTFSGSGDLCPYGFNDTLELVD